MRPEFICRSKGSTVQRAAMKQVFTFLSAAQTLVGRPGWARTLASFHRISSLNGIRRGDSEDIFQIISHDFIFTSSSSHSAGCPSGRRDFCAWRALAATTLSRRRAGASGPRALCRRGSRAGGAPRRRAARERRGPRSSNGSTTTPW